MKAPLLALACALAAFGQTGPTLTTLYRYSVSGGDAHNPRSGLVPAGDGTFYGTTYYGGASTNCPDGCGSIYQFIPPASPGGAWTDAVLHSFQGGADGFRPESGVIVDANGIIYGTTSLGGTSGHGTAYELIPPASPGGAWTHTIIHHFSGADGSFPYSSLTFGANGVLYGTTEYGGASKICKKGCGTVFSLTPPASPGGAWTETVLYSFHNGAGDGSNPIGGLIVDAKGILYGTTSNSKPTTPCTYGCGKVFQLMPPAAPGGAWAETLLHSFVFTDGSRAFTALTFGPNGALYGTTNNGGTSTACNHGCGVVFQLAPPKIKGGKWRQTVIHSFGGHGMGGDGAQPWADIVIGANGILYGSTLNGGAGSCIYPGSPGCGSVYQIAPPSSPGGPWIETVLYSYTGGEDGADPIGNLYIGSDGTLYGTTSVGGNSQHGTIFSLKP